MKLLFKQRAFSWFGSYDIFDETGETVYTVKGQLAWGHCFKVFDATGQELGTVQSKIFSWLPTFEIYQNGVYMGGIRKEFSFFRPKFTVDFCGWSIEGDFFEWDYRIVDGSGRGVATVSKELFNWTDTYSIDIHQPEDALPALMLVLAIDAEKSSRN